MNKQKDNELVTNRRALHDYELIETYEAGISLQGTEVKSLRANGGSLQEAYVKVIHNELWLIGSSIAPYRFGNIHNHVERRDRKLLMHKREVASLKEATQEKGLTIIPLAIYLKNGRMKVRIASAKGRKHRDKRQVIKEREEKRHIAKVMKNLK